MTENSTRSSGRWPSDSTTMAGTSGRRTTKRSTDRLSRPDGRRGVAVGREEVRVAGLGRLETQMDRADAAGDFEHPAATLDHPPGRIGTERHGAPGNTRRGTRG